MSAISLKRIGADGTIGRQAGGPTKIALLSLTAGSDAATADIYDDEAGTGTVVLTIKAAANTTASVPFEGAIVLRSRGYVNLTGTTPFLNVGLV